MTSMQGLSRRAALAASVFTAFCAFGFVSAVQADGGAAHKSQSMLFGTSGSSIEHLIDGQRIFCYTGTLGALVTDGNNDYILSNNHVLAKENEPDSSLLAADGNEIIQPGLLDQGACTLNGDYSGDLVGSLSHYVPLNLDGKRNNPIVSDADAAIAESNGAMASDGEIMDIGVLTDAAAAPAYVNSQDPMLVQKSGRTTGHTKGEVVATGVTVDVKYQNGISRFLNQIEIQGLCDSDFSDGGDSGSLITTLEDGSTARAPVGLLFAGGGASTFANPIQDALDELSVAGAPALSMVTGNIAKNVDSSVPNCGDDGDGGNGGPGNGGGPGGGGPGGGGRPFQAADPFGLDIAADVAALHSQALFALDGVWGHGIGVNARGEPTIRVYVESERREVGQGVPAALDGVPVQVVVTGPILAE